MTFLYSAKCSASVRSSILMIAHARHNDNNCFWKYLPCVLEFATAIGNILLGFYYIRTVSDNVLFEAIVYGFIVIETPKLVLVFL